MKGSPSHCPKNENHTKYWTIPKESRGMAKPSLGFYIPSTLLNLEKNEKFGVG